MIIRSITFALMSKQSAFDYKILASYLLPKGILEYFDCIFRRIPVQHFR